MADTLTEAAPTNHETLAEFTARFEAERANAPKPSGRLVYNTAPEKMAWDARLSSVSTDLQTVRNQLAEFEASQSGGTRRPPGMAFWESTAGGTAIAEANPVTARVERARLMERIATLESALRHAGQCEFQHVDGVAPLHIRVSRECCQAAEPEYRKLMQSVRDSVASLATAMRAAEDLLSDLERNGTAIVGPLEQIHGPIGTVSGDGNAIDSWLADLDAYLGK